MKRILLILLFLVFLSPSAFAASEVEDAFYGGLGIGSAGWDYGYDDDEEDAEEIRQREIEEKEKAERARERAKEQDFFSFSVGTTDRQVSRTDKQDEKVRGRELRKNVRK